MRKLFLLVLGFLLAFSVFAQTGVDYSLNDEIKKLLSPGDLQEYNQAQSLIKEGDKLKDEAGQIQAQADDLKTSMAGMKKSKRRKASKKYDELHNKALDKYNEAFVKYILAYKKLYKLYDKELQGIQTKIKAENKAGFDRKMSLSQQSYKTAMSYIKKGVKEKKDPQAKYDNYKQGYEMIKRAVWYQQDAFKIYFDQIYAPQTQPAVAQTKPKQQSTQKPTQTQQKPIMIYDQPIQQQTQTKPKQQTTQRPKSQQPTYIYNPPTQTRQTPTQQTTYKPRTSTRPKNVVYFRVQVAASRVPLSQAKLRSIYPGRIYQEYDTYDGRYKYLTYEKFHTYESARSFKYSCGVPGAFVVAYKNGKRVRDICLVVPCQR